MTTRPGTGGRRGRVLASAGALLLSSTLAACGSDVVVAEQARQSDASGSSDAGEVDADFVDIMLCGTSKCTGRSVVIPGVGKVSGLPCCHHDPQGFVCGLVEVTECVPLNQEGRIESSCPSIPNTALGTLDGCCRPDNTCGVLANAVDLGCTQVPFLSQFVSCAY